MEEKETLGRLLRREREKKNLSLKDLATNTRVKERFLKAIEEDRYELLPSPIYVKGFLSAMAKALHLDPKEILMRYDHERSSKGEPVVPMKPRSEKSSFKGMSHNLRQIGLVFGVIALCLLISYFSHPFLSGPSKEVPLDKPEDYGRVSVSSPLQPISVAHQPESKPLSVILKATEETWVQIQVDGQSKGEALFKPGEQSAFQALDRIELWVGNAGGLDILINESPVERFGRSGEVVRLVITSQGVVRRGREEEKPVQRE